ncbi:hypothetical protein C8R43DRAFT_998591 [Mycena crocata]|nr:hypothetical protein C8R43DRAFT_998591 [Mycena crocata]
MFSILLLAPTSQKSSDASIVKYIHPPPYISGPYTRIPDIDTLPYVPTLGWFCLTKLALFPEQVNCTRLRYQPPPSDAEYDLLRALIPSLARPDFDWAPVDPRLWVTLAQVYDNLPPIFTCYPIPLADEHVSLLQRVQSTPQFSLVTILELPGCSELSDATIVNLKHLHSLCALDASSTTLSQYAIKVLSGTVLWSDDQTRRGPWGLRILRLRNCRSIDDKILPHISSFHLLTVLDLRGTHCHSDTFYPTFQAAPRAEHDLYCPNPLRHAVSRLASDCGLFSSPTVFRLYINNLYHTTPGRPKTRETRPENVCVTFGPGQIVIGSSADPEAPKDQKPRRGGILNGRGSFSRRLRNGASSSFSHSVQNHLAAQEVSAHAAEQDALSFYSSGNVNEPRLRPRGYTYPPEAPLPPSLKDELLMLYRPPPPWAALEATTPVVPLSKPTRSTEVVTAFSQQKLAGMAKFHEQVNVKRRKIQERDVQAERAMPAPETAPVSRNPFRRKESQLAASSTSKPLRPISSIVTPPLPLATQLKNHSAGGDLNSGALGTSISTLGRTRTDSGGHADKLPPKDKRKSAVFDWGGWGKK